MFMLDNDIRGNVRNNVVAAKRIRGSVGVGVVDVISEKGTVFTVKPVIEPAHSRVFANRIRRYFLDLIRDGIWLAGVVDDWALSYGISINDRCQRWRLCKNLGTEGGVWHSVL